MKLQLELCAKLELLADKLPNDFDTQDCLVLAKNIFPILKNAHDFEEQVLFPALKAQHSENNRLSVTLERLRFEHWEDESFAEELRDSLVNLALNNNTSGINSISYMLRGFFEGVRRHVAFEREHILPYLSENPTL